MTALYDTSQALEYGDITGAKQGSFEELRAGPVSPEDAVWLRFTVKNSSESEQFGVFVTYPYTFTDFVDVWFQPTGGPPQHVAVHNDTRLGDRQVQWGQPTARFPLAAGQSALVHVRLSSAVRYPTTIRVSSQAGWTSRSTGESLLRGAQIGLSALLVFTCLAVAFSIRDRSLALLALVVASGLGRGLNADGTVLWIVGDQGQALTGYVMMALVCSAFALLVRSFGKPGHLWRWLDLAMKWSFLPFGFMLLAYVLGFESVGLRVQAIAVPGVLIVSLIAVGRLMTDPTRGARALALFVGVVTASTLFKFGLAMRGSLYMDDKIPWMVGQLVLGVAAAQRTRGLFDDRAEALRNELAQAQRAVALSTAYARYVPHEFLRLLDTPDILEIRRGEQVQTEMTLFFSDIRGFTSMTENLTPAETFDFINDYLAAMVPDFDANQGVIDKYIGDAIMGLFSPGDDQDGADRALQCAIGNLAALKRYNQQTGRELRVGIGLHTGPVMLGMLGSEDRLNATVLGDSVNLASRVEAMTKAYGAQILITESTHKRLKLGYATRPMDRVRVKGKLEPVTVYEVFQGTELEAEKALTRQRFVDALRAFQAGRMAEALGGFEGVLASFDDVASALYVERCHHYLEVGVPEDWDGVTTLKSKSG